MDNLRTFSPLSVVTDTRDVVGYPHSSVKAPDITGIGDTAANMHRIANELDRLTRRPQHQDAVQHQ